MTKYYVAFESHSVECIGGEERLVEETDKEYQTLLDLFAVAKLAGLTWTNDSGIDASLEKVFVDLTDDLKFLQFDGTYDQIIR